MTYKLTVQNAKIVLKTLAGNILNIQGIKDLFTGTGSVSNNLINWKLLHYTDTDANLTALNPVLGLGQIAFTSDLLYASLNQPRFKVGNGTDAWIDLDYIPEGSGSATTTEVQEVTGTTITLSTTPSSVRVYKNGQRLNDTVTASYLADYSITGDTITLANAADTDLFIIDKTA